MAGESVAWTSALGAPSHGFLQMGRVIQTVIPLCCHGTSGIVLEEGSEADALGTCVHDAPGQRWLAALRRLRAVLVGVCVGTFLSGIRCFRTVACNATVERASHRPMARAAR